ncbi:uncharacterized protein LOC122372920 isoform X3 [Amphibalanus amphitrite]|uniref:uncharacterized protein LOC122372920 isoform X3 n=1 Tax=Amphibalanus amphitrite TaxID=1232801 RepID=UPI001C911731|nr:uncharacterized protein LOC122372920 isoform X3 [Amphibalanus amphitrite]
MASREELSGKKASELQQMLEDRGLDPSGKKSELVERLIKASGAGNGSRGADGEAKPPSAAAPGPMAAGSGDPQSLLLQLRILKEKEALTEQEISNRARMEQEQARIDARRQQLVLEERLAEIGSPVADADLRSAAINVSERAPERAGAADALAQHIQRSLLPRAELSPFSGNVQEYCLFLRTFDMCVANRTTDQNELLAYLEQFTRGRPNRLVRNCLHLGESGYQRARSALEREYGNPHVLIDSYVNKLRSWPKVASGDVQGLDQLVLFLVEVENAMTTISMGELEHPRTLREVVQKLPTCLRDRWLREADRLMEQGRDGSNFGFVGFGHLVDFLERELRVLKNPVFGVSSSRSSDGHGSQKVNAVTFSGARPSCSFCKGSHHLDLCDKLRFRPYSERKTFIQERRLCFGCLQPGHQARFCKSRLTCQVCGSRHASLLHRTADQGTAARAVGAADSPAPGAEVRPKVVSAGVGVQPVSGASATMMPVLPVSLRGKGGREVLTNAFLDQRSSGSFITSRLAGQLGLDKEEVSIRIDTVTGVGQEARSAVMRGAEVSPIVSDECFALPPLFTLDSIPVSLQDRCEGADRNQ